MALSWVYDEASLPYLTADLPGVGGAIKRYDEDFRVEEIPLYPACGSGTHTYLTIRKQGLTTLAAVGQIARALGKLPRDIGYAGLKDAHGITQQRVSVEHVEPDRIAALALSRIQVVSVERHTNKIKLGHLAGNRFVIRIRGAAGEALSRAEAILDILGKRGVPNYFGPQRFGVRGDNAAVGRAALAGDDDEAVALILGRPSPADRGEVRKARELFDAGDWKASAAAWPAGFREQTHICRALIRGKGNAHQAWQAVHHTLRKLYLSAFQSALFNHVLANRMLRLDRLETGDLAWKHRNGACFHVEDAAVEQPRCEALEISPTGPLFGERMTEARENPGRQEAKTLAQAGLDTRVLRTKGSTKLKGARRPLRVPLGPCTVAADRDGRGLYLCLSFELPPGAYATSVTREVCKKRA